MATKYHQISLCETFSVCQDMLIEESPSFFNLLSEHFDIDQFIPSSFFSAFYRSIGRNRIYPLQGFLSAFILQKICSIPTDSLLLLFLNICKELRDFCGFSKVPDASLLSRFKQDFEPYIELMFQQMVDDTEPICQLIDSSLAQMLTFDTSGIELYVKENNPKTLNALIKKLKAYYKNNPDVDPYKMAYGLMPSQAASCADAKQMYINGHFCYADKFAILTNGLGIVRHISFIDDDDFKSKHPDLVIEKKTDSPDEDKSIGDASALVPVLDDFFSLHPDFHPDTFLGDSAFDSAETYGSLINEFHFSKALIPYNKRNESFLKKVGYNAYGYPTCPNDSTLDMKYCGMTREKGRADRIKWICPKMHFVRSPRLKSKECDTMRKTYSPEFKSKMVLEVLRGERMLNEIASDHEVHPNMLTRWKTEATNNFHLLFENENAKIRKQSKEYEAQIDELHRQIGKLTAQYDWMKKKSGI